MELFRVPSIAFVLVALLATALAAAVRAEPLPKEGVVVLPLRGGKGLDPAVVEALDELLAVAAGDLLGFDVTTRADIETQLDREKMKDALACNDTSCAAELAGGLGKRFLLTGTVKKLAQDVILTLNLIDTKSQKATRAQAKGANREEALAELMSAGVRDLARRLGIAVPTSPVSSATSPPSASSPTLANRWDIARDFSVTSNPNGPYSVGWVPALKGAFSLYDQVDPGVSGCATSLLDWHSSRLSSRAPVVAKNITATTPCHGVPPGAVNLHPGPKGELTLLRWTSPVAGRISIVGWFGAGDSGIVSYFIFRDGMKELYSLRQATGDGPFSLLEEVSVGTTIDFLVGEGYGGGSTPLAAIIERK